VDVIASGFDIAFRVRDSVEDSSLVMRSYGLDPHLLVASPDLLLRQGRPLQPQDLKRMSSVGVISPEGRHFWHLQAEDRRAQQVEHHPSLVSDDLQVLYQAVVGGIGVAQLPRFVCRAAIDAGRLVPLLPAWSPPPGNVHAVYPSRHGHTPALDRFLQFIGQHLPRALQRIQQGALADNTQPLGQLFAE